MKICILSDSGLAGEMVHHAKTVLEAVCKASYLSLEFCHGQSEETELQDGIPSRETVDLCRTSDAVLFCLQQTGAYTRKYLDLLRSKLGLFGTMRLIRIFPALSACAAVKDAAAGVDCLLIQEEWSDGMLPEQGEKVIDGDLCGYDVLLSNSQTAQLTARTALCAAQNRKKSVVFTDLCEKMSSAALRRRVTNIAASEFSEVELSHLTGTEAVSRFLRSPGSIDVLLADPLLGDLLFAQGAAMSGAPNLQCAAYFGYGKQGVYYNAMPLPESGVQEDATCPAALILACAMALRHSLGLEWEAHCIEKAVAKVLSLGRTADLHQPSLPTVSATVFSAYIAQTTAEYISSAE
ncbi:MAG: isocitrate/isopropylmalate family dehydrogenase [Oscillospiraceae bacterium]|nr:isocitrate/isopropylmalate family dehydrogenase [Oscillospiraceae bacterium]